jgi:hypothetical protein
MYTKLRDVLRRTLFTKIIQYINDWKSILHVREAGCHLPSPFVYAVKAFPARLQFDEC